MSEHVHVVAGVLRDGRGRFLLGRRAEGAPYAGCWEFPGGKVRDGETYSAALAREWLEELGVTASVGDFVGWSFFDDHDPPFKVTTYEVSTPDLPRMLVHDGLLWVTGGELLFLRGTPHLDQIRRSGALRLPRRGGGESREQ